MAKFTITVVERITAVYDAVEIEAEDYEEAEAIVEEMRVQGELGDPTETIDDLDYEWDDEAEEASLGVAGIKA